MNYFEEKQQLPVPTIALVGRANVGKSTLFNKLIEEGHALTDNKPGTTRTRNIREGVWRGEKIRFIDTGGLGGAEKTPFDEDIANQVDIALREADLIVLVADAEVGVLPEDITVAKKIRATKKSLMLIVNKVDNERDKKRAQEYTFEKLGIKPLFYISAHNGRGTGDFLDAVHEWRLSATVQPVQESNSDALRVALIGKPNVGKSSLFNALVKQKAVIVSPIAHTTREPFDTEVTWNDKPFVFVDTAGIRKQAIVRAGVEKGGVDKSLRALRRSHVALLVLDATEPVSTQDKHLAGDIADSLKGIVIVVNKWDEVKDDDGEARKNFEASIRLNFPFLSYAPILFVSAKTKLNVESIFPILLQINHDRHIEISEAELEEFLRESVRQHKPSRGKGTNYPKLLSLQQINTNPPIFQVVIKTKTSLHRSYLHFIENRLRRAYGFIGTPLIIKMKKGFI